MDLIVEKFALLFRSLLICKLPSANGVPGCDNTRPEDVEATCLNDTQAGLAHDLIKEPGVGLELKVTFFSDLREASEES